MTLGYNQCRDNGTVPRNTYQKQMYFCDEKQPPRYTQAIANILEPETLQCIATQSPYPRTTGAQFTSRVFTRCWHTWRVLHCTTARYISPPNKSNGEAKSGTRSLQRGKDCSTKTAIIPKSSIVRMTQSSRLTQTASKPHLSNDFWSTSTWHLQKAIPTTI